MAVYLEYVTEIYENGHNAVFTSCGHAWTKQHSETEGLLYKCLKIKTEINMKDNWTKCFYE